MSYHPLSSIDWSSPLINRAGILPIYNDGKYTWLGFGVNKSKSNIITIGGTFENYDHDLLDTAIREYNEETKNILPPITYDTISSSYVIATSYSYTIIYDISNYSPSFEPSDELYGIVWLTLAQFKNIVDNVHVKYNGITLFNLGIDVSMAYPIILSYLDKPLRIKIANPKFNSWLSSRPRKISNTVDIDPIGKAVITTNYDKFINDTLTDSKWYQTAVVIRPNLVTVHREFNFYYLKNSTFDEVYEKLKINHPRIYFALRSDVPRKYKHAPYIHNIEDLMIRHRVPRHVQQQFLSHLSESRQMELTDSVIDESSLILRYEKLIYQDYSSTHVIMTPRACIYEGIMAVNNKLRDLPTGLPYNDLLYYISRNKSGSCHEITPIYLVSLMLRFNLVKQNPETTSIYLYG